MEKKYYPYRRCSNKWCEKKCYGRICMECFCKNTGGRVGRWRKRKQKDLV